MEGINNNFLTPDQIAAIEKQRTISDAELLIDGAKYVIDTEGNKRLDMTESQIEAARQEMDEDIPKKEGVEGKQDFFESIKRPYGVQDIKNLQQALTRFEENRKSKNATFVFQESAFYEFLTSFQEHPEKLPAKDQVPTASYERLEVGIFNTWKENLLKNAEVIIKKRPSLAPVIDVLKKENPQTLNELRELYKAHPEVDQVSAVEYQEGITDYVTSNFVHVNMARASGYAYEQPKTEMRIYTNPPAEAIPLLAEQLTLRAQQKNIPLYYKFTDYSFDMHGTDQRLDKLIVYTSKEYAPQLVSLLKEIKEEKPEWFNGRELPTLVSKAEEGIGLAEDPSEYQEKNFSGTMNKGVSFSSVRAKMLCDAWKDTMKGIITVYKDWQPRGGRTFKQLFDDQFRFTMKNLAVDSVTIEETLQKLGEVNFDITKINPVLKKKFFNLESNIHDALFRTMQDIIPAINADSLLPFVEKQIKEKAPHYGVNPDNLALNTMRKNVSFEQVNPQEQIKRFGVLSALFKTGQEKSPFVDFFDKVTTSPTDIPQEVVQSFPKAIKGLKVVKNIFDLFLEIKRNQVQKDPNINSRIETQKKVIKSEISQVSGDISELFRWSLRVFVKRGETVGLLPNVKEEEIEGLVNDFKTILSQVT
jgi:hypothetical protein